MSELDYAYGSFGAAGVIGLISVVGSTYGVVTRSRTRVNLPFFINGMALATVPVALGGVLSAAYLYKIAGTDVEQLGSVNHGFFIKEKKEYKNYQEQAAISGIIASLGLPIIASPILLGFDNLSVNAIRIRNGLVVAGSLIMIGGIIGMGVNTANAASVRSDILKRIDDINNGRFN
jgi:hypothetical protein